MKKWIALKALSNYLMHNLYEDRKRRASEGGFEQEASAWSKQLGTDKSCSSSKHPNGAAAHVGNGITSSGLSYELQKVSSEKIFAELCQLKDMVTSLVKGYDTDGDTSGRHRGGRVVRRRRSFSRGGSEGGSRRQTPTPSEAGDSESFLFRAHAPAVAHDDVRISTGAAAAPAAGREVDPGSDQDLDTLLRMASGYANRGNAGSSTSRQTSSRSRSERGSSACSANGGECAQQAALRRAREWRQGSVV